MTPRHLLPALCLALACRADDPAIPLDCTRAEPVQLVSGPYKRLDAIQRARDTTFMILSQEDAQFVTRAGAVCGADPVVLADGAPLLPTRVELDPLDDDPTLVCDQQTYRHYRVDLSGERPPQLLLPYLSCLGRPTKYGPLFIGGWGYLRLFRDFPDDTTATKIREQGGNDVLVLDEWILYTHASDLHAYALSTGKLIDLPGKVLGMEGSGDHVLWFDYEDIATATLVDLSANTTTILGTFDRQAAWDVEQSIPGFSHWTWDFDPSGRYVYHILPGVQPEAFDLAGRHLALPAPGEVVRLLDDGVLSVTREDGQVHFTRPHDTAPLALDAHLADGEGGRAFSVVDDHLEQIVDGDLARIDLDGSPARVLATGVGPHNHWLADHLLLTFFNDGTLARIDTATGERTELFTHVLTWQFIGDELYILRADSPDPAEDGLWYLSPAALGLPDAPGEHARAAAPRPARHRLAPPTP